MTLRPWPGLSLVREEPGQATRLQQFRARYPAVIIGPGEFGTWQARIPEPTGETIIVRHRLADVLDKLDTIYPG
jgi:hypothetical protein